MQSVEATAEAGQLMYKPMLGAQGQVVLPITDYVVVLSMNWALHGQDSWQGDYVTLKYADHTLWDADFLNEILQYFLDVAKAKSIPSVAEFAWRSDKVTKVKHPGRCATSRLHAVSLRTNVMCPPQA